MKTVIGLGEIMGRPAAEAGRAALSFAAAASCLAHSIKGDGNVSSRAEAEAPRKGAGSGRVVRSGSR